VTLIESLIAILIFSMGILALVGMYSSAVSRTTDSQYRNRGRQPRESDPRADLANVDRSTAANLTASLTAFQHNPGGADCAFKRRRIGNAGSHGVGRRDHRGRHGTARRERHTSQILVDTANFNRVTVTICWRAPGDTYAHRHFVSRISTERAAMRVFTKSSTSSRPHARARPEPGPRSSSVS